MTPREFKIYRHCVISRATAISTKKARQVRSLLQVLIALVIFKSEETDPAKLIEFEHDINVILGDIQEIIEY